MVKSSDNSRRPAKSVRADDGIVQARVTRAQSQDRETRSLKELRAMFAEFQSIKLNTGSMTYTVSFAFDAQMNAVLRSIGGASFNSKTKKWKVPLHGWPVLQRHAFRIEELFERAVDNLQVEGRHANGGDLTLTVLVEKLNCYPVDSTYLHEGTEYRITHQGHPYDRDGRAVCNVYLVSVEELEREETAEELRMIEDMRSRTMGVPPSGPAMVPVPQGPLPGSPPAAARATAPEEIMEALEGDRDREADEAGLPDLDEPNFNTVDY
jgi:hypothetical protein